MTIATAADLPLIGLLTALFMVGLTGGFAHCVGMCGPFVMAQVSSRLETVKAPDMREWRRLSGGLLLPYHLGRLTTYVGMGALAGFLSGRLTLFWDFRQIIFVLLIGAATLFLILGLKGLGVPLPRFVTRASNPERGISGLLSRLVRPLFEKPTGGRGYLLGIALGFLPCGMVIAAVAASAAGAGSEGALHDALRGGLGMAAFALGTMPALMLTGVAGHLAGSRLAVLRRRVGPFLLLFSAGFLVYLAWKAVGAI